MKHIFCFLLLLLFASSQCFSQVTACDDSVVITYYNYYDDWSGNPPTYSITTDTFHLNNGIRNSCVSSGNDPGNLVNTSCSSGFWSKSIPTFDGQNRITQNLIIQGSASGWHDSIRTNYTYDLTNGNLITITNSSWDGSNWILDSEKDQVYDPNNNLIEITDRNYQNGNPINKSRYTWTYAGNLLQSRLIESGSGSNWINNTFFSFSYSATGGRDSVLYLIWNSANSNWDTLGHTAYYINGVKIADFTKLDTVLINGTPLIDSTTISLDTLENIVHKYELIPTHHDPMGYFYTMNINDYDYFGGQLLNTWRYSAEYWDDGSGFGLNWYCTGDDFHLTYDTDGFLIETTQSARCVMPNIFTTDYYYDSQHRLVKQTGYLDSNTRSQDYNYNFYYSSPDNITLGISPFNQNNVSLCQGTQFSPNLFSSGGCGNYHYQWTPSLNLSSDTVLNPTITVSDSMNYVITVSDDNGISTSMQYAVYPEVPVTIQIDTLPCSGCQPALFTYYSHNFTYTWYFDGNSITNSDSSVFTPTQTGYYYVSVTSSTSLCTSNSDSLYFTVSTGIGNPENYNYTLRPNPTSDISLLEIHEAIQGNYTIYLTCLSGEFSQLLAKGNGSSGINLTLPLDAKKLLPGTYIITINSENYIRHFRWIVTH